MVVDHLRYDEVAFKASHNSIDRRASIVDQLSGTGGLVEPCRGLELDLVQSENRFEWRIQHGARDHGPELRNVLDEIAGWARSSDNWRHPVITIHFDLKNAHLDHTDFAAVFDAMLVDVFGRQRIYTPGEVTGHHEDLVRAARSGGWATFARLRGKFVFCLSGNGGRKVAYARHEPRDRVCFADYPGSRPARRKGNRVFANLFVAAAGYPASLGRYRLTPGFVARGYNIVTRGLWDVSVSGGASFLSTDVLDKREYSLSGQGFAPRFPVA